MEITSLCVPLRSRWFNLPYHNRILRKGEKMLATRITREPLFDGRLDDNNMKDVTTEMIPFASLAPLRLRVKSRTRKTRKTQGRKE